MEYLKINQEAWNQKTNIHFDSAFYDVKNFIQDNTSISLNPIELNYLDDIEGKSVLHLQCHFGQDSISLSRLGASKVVGVDLSDLAIEKALELNKQCQATVSFICCDVYSLKEHLTEQFDYVFTSYGTIGWLPDLSRWAEIIQHFLKPGGKFIFAEFHPVVWMFDDDFQNVGYNYFNSGPIIETIQGTYTDKDAAISTSTVSWNHGIGEVLQALIQHQLIIQDLSEYDYSPYNCFKHTQEIGPKQFRIQHLENKIPMVYSVLAQKAV